MWITPYLGKPGNMIALPAPDKGAATPERGDSTSTLLNGGLSTVGRLHVKRTYPLQYDMLQPVEADVLLNFYQRGYGLGPWVYVDPTALNVLGYDTASCGIRTQADAGWSATTGTLSRTTGAPTPTSGVLSWSGYTGTNSTLQPTFSALRSPVNVLAEPVTVSLWAKASAAVTVNFRIAGYDTTGAVVNTALTASFGLTTAWAPISVSAVAGVTALAGSAYLLPQLVLPTASGAPASIQICQPMVEYNATRSAWRYGQGSPRVLIKDTPGNDTPALGYSAHTFTLGEV